jgi:hypothetical protein
MSYDIVQNLVDQLGDETSSSARIRVIRRLAAMGDPRAVTELSNIYLSEEEPPEVKQAAEAALGVFKAIQEAIEQKIDVELPDPSTVKDPLISPERLKRLVGVLAVLMLVFWVVDAALLVLPAPMPPVTDVLAILRTRYDQVRMDADNLQRAWQPASQGGNLDCGIAAPAPGSTSSSDLAALAIDSTASPALAQARGALMAAIDQLVIPANNRLVGCTANVPVAAEENMQWVSRALASLDETANWLAQAEAAAAITPGPTPGAASPPVETQPPTAIPTPTVTPAPTVNFDPLPYIRAMRDRVDLAMTGRGVGVMLPTFWDDVRRTGQSFGCRQSLSAADLVDYTSITPDIAALEPRLQDIAVTLNLGLALARDSLANFQQGCLSGNFSTLLDVGQQQIQQAVAVLTQASQRLDELQAEYAGRQ